jgi:hypothetical protein
MAALQISRRNKIRVPKKCKIKEMIKNKSSSSSSRRSKNDPVQVSSKSNSKKKVEGSCSPSSAKVMA